MPNYISSLQLRVQNITPVYRPGYSFGHRNSKKNNNLQRISSIDEKEPDFKSEMATTININSGVDSNQQNKQGKKYSKTPTKNKIAAEKPFGLDSLEFISQLNKMSLKSPNRTSTTLPETR